MKLFSKNASFGGTQGVYSHNSTVCNCEMVFAVYMPPQAKDGPVPVLWYLSGLTCTHENAMVKAGLQAQAAKRGIAIVFPDTSPRGEGIADDYEYAMGQGAGFYVNATQAPWKSHFQMYDYILNELPALIGENFAVTDKRGITGHSMGGHGALVMALNNPETYQSVSAFAPIANPSNSEWGQAQLSAYLGDTQADREAYDATALVQSKGWPRDILIDQGADDKFLKLLQPERLAHALTAAHIPCTFRMQAGYDHSYFFVSTFGADHVDWHADRLTKR